MMEITDVPICPDCGERLVPVLMKTAGHEYPCFMCDCHNELIAEELKFIRERGTVLIVEHVNEDTDETCEECLFSGAFPEPLQFTSPN